MSKKAKDKSIADKINEFLAPKDLLDPEKDQDEANCQFSEFDNEGYEKVLELGQIRKRNVKSLDEVDVKYKGVLSQRRLDDSEGDSEEESEEMGSDSEDEYQSGSEGVEEGDSADDDDEEDEGEDDDGDMFLASNEDDADEPDAAPEIMPTQPASSETLQKSVSVKNQLEIWEKLLEVRIKSHKLLLTANSLPLPETHKRLSESQEFETAAEKTFQGVEKLLSQLQSFQQLMCSRFPETKELSLTAGKKRKSTSKAAPESKLQRLDAAASAVAENYTTLWSYSKPVLQKWHDRTNVIAITKSKQAGATNLLKNIEDSLINRSELVKKTRAYRGGYDVFDWKNSLQLFTNEDGKTVTEADIGEGLQDPTNKLACPEIFDDSDFYHQLLRELIQSKSEGGQGQLEIAKKYQELQKLRGKMKKTVDTRASKGRKIRYVVHNKMMNFMAPTIHEQWSDEAKDELYSSLFGQADKMK